jgi:serine/threonine-protein kinase
MAPERWQKIVDLAEAAADLASDQRAAFLAEACNGDGTLRSEVESLLESDEQSEGLIETPVFQIAAELIADDQAGSMVGQVVGAYRIVDLLGAGGMGEVYLAYDTRLRRKVALKFLPGYFTSDRTRVCRLEQEARAASALNHPNILTVYEIGESAGTQFIAAEFVEGRTLRQHMESVQMTPGEVLDVAIQAASALAVAHQAGIVHRDIKPENVMIRSDGYVKVLDFGLAKLDQADSSPGDPESAIKPLVDTEPGLVMGTPKYMSPEQVRGLDVDRTSDIFSLGVVLYEMIAGRVPFDGPTTSDVIAAILKTEPTPLAHCLTEVPVELQYIASKALSKQRVDRYQTAEELLDDLRRLKARIETESKSVPLWWTGLAAATRQKGLITDTPQEPAVRNGKSEARTALSIESLIGQVKRHHKGPLALGWLLIPVAAIFVFAFNKFAGQPTPTPLSRETKPVATVAEVKSIAVLPFKPVAVNDHDEALEMGIADTFITTLSSVRGIIVRPISAVRKYSGLEQDPIAAGREQQVDAVMEGSIQKEGQKVRVTVRLLSTRDGSSLWAYKCDQHCTDIFAAQDSISERVAEALSADLTSEDRRLLAKHYTESGDAYRAYMTGRFFWNKRTEEGFRKATAYFQQAIKMDPKYSLAYVGLADSILFGGGQQLSPESLAAKAKATVNKALEIDATLGEAHATLGLIAEGLDWSEAEEEYKRAIELNPNYATAHHWYGECLALMGRFDEALEEMKHASELDPLSLIIIKDTGEVFYCARKYDLAIEHFRKVLEMDPNYFVAHVYMGLAYGQKRDFSTAIGELEKARQLQDTPDALAALGYVYGISGRKREALRILGKLRQVSRHHLTFSSHWAMIYAGLGDKDKTFEYLEKAYHERILLTGLKVDPAWDNLRSDARFVDLMKRVGLTP